MTLVCKAFESDPKVLGGGQLQGDHVSLFPRLAILPSRDCHSKNRKVRELYGAIYPKTTPKSAV